VGIEVTLAEDKLFATLDPTSRQVKLGDGQTAILTDTVGFIHKLPHQLVDAFRATLEEVNRADVLIEVVDVADAHATEHRATVQQVLDELGAGEKPRLVAWNKADLIANPDIYDPTKGYSYADVGTRLILRAQQGNNIAPSMYYSWKMPGDIGGSFYEDNIENCNSSVISKGHVAQQEPGAMEGPTIQGLEALLAKDPAAYWDTAAKKYVSTKNPSPRVFPIPLYDPDVYQLNKQTGRNATLIVKNWLGFFLEDISGNQVTGRIFPIVGVAAATGPTTGTPLAFVIRLVQ